MAPVRFIAWKAGVIEMCAQAAHEVNRVWSLSLGDQSQVHWEDAPEWQRTSCMDGVKGVIRGDTAQESHEAWLRFKEADGWKYGPSKNADKKEHPNMVPYNDLPAEQRARDELFVSTVEAIWTKLNSLVV